MRIARSLKISRKQLGAHKLRTALALAGIIIGVSAVIVMVAAGKGAEREVLGRIEAMGTNLLIVNAGPVQRTAGRQEIRGTATTLTLRDSEVLLLESPSVKAAAPVQSAKLQVKYGNLSTNTVILGTTPDYPAIRGFRVERGEFFSEEQNMAGRRVAVLGRTVVQNLFGKADPVGETIRIGRVAFEVIGVMSPKGADLNAVDQDDQIFIPIRTALRRVFNLDHIGSIHIEAKGRDRMASAEDEIRDILRERHRLDKGDKPDDFTIQNQSDLLEAERETGEMFTLLTGSLAAVSLLVGGIGILAIMLMAVRERTNEIGLRMAVGASRRDILVQFLFEATALGVGGGTVGAAVGVAAAAAVNAVTRWRAEVSLFSVLIAFGFSLAVGLFFGVVPARKASRLHPIEALRSE
ncbi:MAG: ABC transporter permease [Candidatus Aminicenantes bacterium]|nr:ABC transporter permease [Candidatus Aminicenantes bacterium]